MDVSKEVGRVLEADPITGRTQSSGLRDHASANSRPVVAALMVAAVFVVFWPLPARSTDPPANPIVVIDTGQYTYRIPYLYLSIRPPLTAVEPVNRWQLFSFAFWMPDGRASMVAGHEAGTPRPREPGRPPPGPNEYLVVATQVTPWRQGSPRPGEQFENSLRSFGTHRYSFRERWGLIEVTPQPGTPASFDIYFGTRSFHDVPMDASLLISCAREDTPLNNVRTVHRLCTGPVALRGLDVMFTVRSRWSGWTNSPTLSARPPAYWPAGPTSIFKPSNQRKP